MQEVVIIEGVEYIQSVKYRILERKLQEKDLEIKRLNELVSMHTPSIFESFPICTPS